MFKISFCFVMSTCMNESMFVSKQPDNTANPTGHYLITDFVLILMYIKIKR